MAKTTWQETFKDSPRLKEIEGLFRLMEKPGLTANQIWAEVSKLTQTLNGDEREKLPAFVKAELVNREPVRVGPPPML